MTAHPRIHPARRMLTEAVTDAAERHGSKAAVWFAEALLDAYGRDHAEQIADALPGMIRREHDTRRRGAALRTRPDMVSREPSLLVIEPDPCSLWRQYALGAVLVAALVAATVYAATAAVGAVEAATDRQIEAGAAEW